MADTRAQKAAEIWVVENDLPRRFGQSFSNKRVLLAWNGKFEFDAVSSDDLIVGNISTSSSRTAGNNLATAKIQKIKCDTLYLLHAKEAKTRFLAFTERDMLEHFEREVQKGRFPKGVKLIHSPLPQSLQSTIEAARKIASDETSPRRLDV